MSPFFSPDGEWIGYLGDGNLRRIAVAGGPPLTVVAGVGAQTRGAVWLPDGAIVYSPDSAQPLSIVPENLRWVVEANPLHWVLDVFRLPIYSGLLPSAATFAMAAGVAVLVLVIGAVSFRATSHRIALYL